MKVVLLGTTASCVLGFRKDLILDLVQRGIKVYAFAIDYDQDTELLVESLGAIPVGYTFNRTGLNPFSDLLNTVKLMLKFKEIDPDIVFSYFSKPVVFGTLAAKFAGVKRRIGMLEGLGFVFTDQSGGNSLKITVLRRVQLILYRIAFPLLDVMIFLNPDDPIDLISKNNLKVKSTRVLGGIGLKLSDYPYSVPPVDPVRFLFVARLLAEKGIFDFLAAAKIVKNLYPNAEFVVLGGLDSGNPGSLSAKDLNEYKSSGLIIHPGHVDNVVDWISGSSVFVLPSYYREGVPRSTQEAMAVGRAVITTDVPGCRDTVNDGENGFLIKRWDPEMLAEKMIFFINNPLQIIRMGEKSHEVAQVQYDALKVNEKLVSMILTD